MDERIGLLAATKDSAQSEPTKVAGAPVSDSEAKGDQILVELISERSLGVNRRQFFVSRNMVFDSACESDQVVDMTAYWSNLVTSCCTTLAWASAEMPVCIRISYFAMFEVADA